jgi:hypothetical protein
MDALLEKVGEGGEQGEGNDVPVDDEDELADAHVERRPADDVEAGEQELQGQHPHEQLHLLTMNMIPPHLSLSFSRDAVLLAAMLPAACGFVERSFRGQGYI